jgi:hypothetical protein
MWMQIIPSGSARASSKRGRGTLSLPEGFFDIIQDIFIFG